LATLGQLSTWSGTPSLSTSGLAGVLRSGSQSTPAGQSTTLSQAR
jgi:hypothetical protein